MTNINEEFRIFFFDRIKDDAIGLKTITEFMDEKDLTEEEISEIIKNDKVILSLLKDDCTAKRLLKGKRSSLVDIKDLF